MKRDIYRYSFSNGVPFRDVEESLLLAVLATESLHGRSLVRLDVSFCLGKKKRACVVDAGTEVGRPIAAVPHWNRQRKMWKALLKDTDARTISPLHPTFLSAPRADPPCGR